MRLCHSYEKNWTPSPPSKNRQPTTQRNRQPLGILWIKVGLGIIYFKPFDFLPPQAVNFQIDQNRKLPFGVLRWWVFHVYFGTNQDWNLQSRDTDGLVGSEVPPRYGKYRDCSVGAWGKSHEGCRSDLFDIGPRTLGSMAANCFSKDLSKNLIDSVKLYTAKYFAGKEPKFFKKERQPANGKIPWSSKGARKITWKTWR